MGNYAIQAGVHKNFDSDEFWFSGLNGAITGAVGGGFGYYSGATASLLGGFSTGVVGSALNGDEPWDVIKSGIWGAALAGASYLMNVGKLADDDFTANQDARETLAKETGFDIRGVDDLYNEQSSVNPKMENADKQEFYITDDDIKASAGRVYKTEEGNWRNNVNVGEKRTMHAHGSLQPERKPTPGDLYSAAKYSDRDHYMLDVPTSTVYKYNGNHINGNVDYSAAEGAAKKAWESGKNIERTWSYKPYKGYDEYYKGYFKW